MVLVRSKFLFINGILIYNRFVSRPDTSQLITEMTRFVPFRLTSPVGKSIRIDQPLDFDLIKNHLEVVYENWESNNASSIQKLIEFIAGTYSTG